MSLLDYHVWRAMLEKFHKLQREPKTMRFEDHIGVGRPGRLTPETHQKVFFMKKLRTCVGHAGGGQVEHML